MKENLAHVLSFRRQVHVFIEPNINIPGHINIAYGGETTGFSFPQILLNVLPVGNMDTHGETARNRKPQHQTTPKMTDHRTKTPSTPNPSSCTETNLTQNTHRNQLETVKTKLLMTTKNQKLKTKQGYDPPPHPHPPPKPHPQPNPQPNRTPSPLKPHPYPAPSTLTPKIPQALPNHQPTHPIQTHPLLQHWWLRSQKLQINLLDHQGRRSRKSWENGKRRPRLHQSRTFYQTEVRLSSEKDTKTTKWWPHRHTIPHSSSWWWWWQR